MIWLERLTDHYKKFALGFGAATAVTSAVFTIFDKPNLLEKAIVSAGAYVACGIGALIWVHIAQTGFTRTRVETHKIADSEIVTRPEGHLAYPAHKCARR